MAVPIEPLKHPYLFIDTETGGIDCGRHSLLSIGLVVGDEGVVRHSMEILVKHDHYVLSGGGMRVNRIDIGKHDIEALDPVEVMAVLDVFLQQYFPCAKEPITLVGHNVSFDRDFLGVYFAENGRPLEPRFSHRLIDTHSIAAALQDAGKLDVESLSSSALFEHFGIVIPEEQRHTALGDALGTFELYWKLVERIR
jgi:DNA polymerase III epsilon subunit-like protein